MTLLSADAPTAADFMACVMILLPPNSRSASDFKYTEFFYRDVHGAGVFILQFPLCARP